MEFQLETLKSFSLRNKTDLDEARAIVLGQTSPTTLKREGHGTEAATAAVLLPPRLEGLRPLQLEAVILSKIRPPLLVRDGYFQRPQGEIVTSVSDALNSFDADPKLSGHIRSAIARSGQVVLMDAPNSGPAGTGWVIKREAADCAIVVTNRHVAEIFARPNSAGGYSMRMHGGYGRPLDVQLAFLNEYGNPDTRDAQLAEVLSHILQVSR